MTIPAWDSDRYHRDGDLRLRPAFDLFALLRPLVDCLDPVFEWVSGSILRPVLSLLEQAEADRFSAAWRAALRKAYPQQADGSTLFPVRRLFIVAGP